MKKLSLLFVLLVSASLVFGQANGLVISNKASGGAIGTAAATVDVASLFNVNQTTASQTLTVPNLTNATNGKTIHINNVGSASFTLLSKTIEPGTGILLRWTGLAWSISGVGNATGGGGGTADSSVFATQYDITFKVDKSGTKVLSDENYSTAEKSKLAGIATGATANDTDANLKNRANHTGQDQISDVSGLQSALDLKQTANSQAVISGNVINWNVTHQYLTLTGNTTFTFSNAADTKIIMVYISNASTSYTVTWPAGIKWGINGAPVQTVGTNTDVYTFSQVNGIIYGAARQ